MEPIRTVVDNLKFRASYGQLGNQTISLYQYANVMANNPKEYMFGHQWVPGSYLNILPNYDLGWETSTMLDIGVDFNLFNNRLIGAYDWYQRRPMAYCWICLCLVLSVFRFLSKMPVLWQVGGMSYS